MRSKIFLFLFVFALSKGLLFAQTDSNAVEMTFDFGITRGRNVNLWPILKKTHSNERNELQILFPFFTKNRTFGNPSKHLQILPLYVMDSSWRGIDRRFVSFYYPSVFRARSWSDSGLVAQSFKFLEFAPAISCLGFSKSASGLFVENNLLFFMWFKRDKLNDQTRFTVFPLYWYFANKQDVRQCLVPFFYQHKTDLLRTTNLALLFTDTRSKGMHKQVFFPFWWHTQLFSQNDTLQKRVVFPFYWQKRDSANNNLVFFPIYYRFNTGADKTMMIFPFYGQSSNTDLQKSSKNYMILYWKNQSPTEKNSVLFPLWWDKTEFRYNDTIRQQALFPIYWKTKDNYHCSTIFFPFVYSYRNKELKRFTVFPLFSKGGQQDSSSSYFAITPLFWHFASHNKIRNRLFPFVWFNTQHRHKDTLYRKIIFPLYWSKHDYQYNNKILFPLFYKIDNPYRNSVTLFPLLWFSRKEHYGDTIYRKTVFPLFWSRRDNFRDNTVMFPIVFDLKNNFRRSISIIPFFSYSMSNDSSRSHLVILPFYWKFDSKSDSRKIIFPFIWKHEVKNDDDNAVSRTYVPFYWQSKGTYTDSYIYFPLVYRLKDRDHQSFTVFPFYSKGQSSDSSSKYFAITPLYWNISNTEYHRKLLFPLLWRTTRYGHTDTSQHTTLFPVLWVKKNSEQLRVTLFPMFFYNNNASCRSTMLFPLFWHRRNRDTTHVHWAFTPLFWHVRKHTDKWNVLFPLVWQTYREEYRDTVHKFNVLPLFWYKKDSYNTHLLALPLFYHFKNNEQQSSTLFPLFSVGSSDYLQRKHRIISPLFWYFKSYDQTKFCLFPLIWSAKDSLQNKLLILPFYYRDKTPFERTTSFFPLFSFSQNSDKTVSRRIITPLYWQFKNRDTKTEVLFPFWWNIANCSSLDSTKSRVFFPFYWSKRGKFDNNKIVFPLFYSIQNKAYQSKTLFPLFSVGHSPDMTAKHLVLSPLFGKWVSPKGTRAYLFPLLQYKRNDTETRWSVLYFLYRGVWRTEYQKTAILWPLCVREKDANRKSFRIAPVLWYSKSDSAKMFSVQPFFYSYRSDTRKTFILSWFLYTHEKLGEQSVSNNLLWKLYEHERCSNGDYQTRVAHLLYANIQKDGRHETSLLPLYHNITQANGDQSKSIFLGFYNYFKQNIPEIGESYEEERLFWLLRFRSNYAKLKREGKAQYLKRK